MAVTSFGAQTPNQLASMEAKQFRYVKRNKTAQGPQDTLNTSV